MEMMMCEMHMKFQVNVLNKIVESVGIVMAVDYWGGLTDHKERIMFKGTQCAISMQPKSGNCKIIQVSHKEIYIYCKIMDKYFCAALDSEQCMVEWF